MSGKRPYKQATCGNAVEHVAKACKAFNKKCSFELCSACCLTRCLPPTSNLCKHPPHKTAIKKARLQASVFGLSTSHGGPESSPNANEQVLGPSATTGSISDAFDSEVGIVTTTQTAYPSSSAAMADVSTGHAMPVDLKWALPLAACNSVQQQQHQNENWLGRKVSTMSSKALERQKHVQCFLWTTAHELPHVIVLDFDSTGPSRFAVATHPSVQSRLPSDCTEVSVFDMTIYKWIVLPRSSSFTLGATQQTFLVRLCDLRDQDCVDLPDYAKLYTFPVPEDNTFEPFSASASPDTSASPDSEYVQGSDPFATTTPAPEFPITLFSQPAHSHSEPSPTPSKRSFNDDDGQDHLFGCQPAKIPWSTFTFSHPYDPALRRAHQLWLRPNYRDRAFPSGFKFQDVFYTFWTIHDLLQEPRKLGQRPLTIDSALELHFAGETTCANSNYSNRKRELKEAGPEWWLRYLNYDYNVSWSKFLKDYRLALRKGTVSKSTAPLPWEVIEASPSFDYNLSGPHASFGGTPQSWDLSSLRISLDDSPAHFSSSQTQDLSAQFQFMQAQKSSSSKVWASSADYQSEIDSGEFPSTVTGDYTNMLTPGISAELNAVLWDV